MSTAGDSSNNVARIKHRLGDVQLEGISKMGGLECAVVGVICGCDDGTNDEGYVCKRRVSGRYRDDGRPNIDPDECEENTQRERLKTRDGTIIRSI